MTNSEQTDHLCKAIDKVIDHFSQEFEVTYATVIGVLQMKIMELHSEAKEDEERKRADDDD